MFLPAQNVRLPSPVALAPPVVRGTGDGGSLSGHGEDDGWRVRTQVLGKNIRSWEGNQRE